MNKLPKSAKQEYVLSSIRERELLMYFQTIQKDFIITQQSDIVGQSKWDAVIFSAGTEMLLEIKVRDWPINQFSTWMIEEPKYDALCDIQSRMFKNKGRHLKKYYVNIFQDAIAFFDLDTVQKPDFKSRDTKVSVMEDKGRKSKQMGFLSTSDATVYPLKTFIPYFNDVSEQRFRLLYPNEENYFKLFSNQK